MADLKLTVGMAVYEDFANVWSTVTALRLYHAEILPQLEIIVVDNSPGTPEGERTKDFVENWVAQTPGLGGAKYDTFTECNSTAQPRNRVFELASAPNVLVMDPHVMIEAEGLRRLMDFYDATPGTMNLYGGALVYDDHHNVSTHFEDVWRSEMWGTWGTDSQYQYERTVELERHPDGTVGIRTHRTEGPVFEVFGMGLGLFTCRKEAWLGFNPDFRGFGGEECYIHTKFRQAGRRCWCLPWLRWIHQFGRPGGVPYPLAVEDKFRNYVIGLSELKLPLAPAIDHFSQVLDNAKINGVLSEFGLDRDSALVTPMPTPGDPPMMMPGGPPMPPQGGEPMMRPDDHQIIQMMQTQIQKMSMERDALREERDRAMGLLTEAQQP